MQRERVRRHLERGAGIARAARRRRCPLSDAGAAVHGRPEHDAGVVVAQRGRRGAGRRRLRRQRRVPARRARAQVLVVGRVGRLAARLATLGRLVLMLLGAGAARLAGRRQRPERCQLHCGRNKQRRRFETHSDAIDPAALSPLSTDRFFLTPPQAASKWPLFPLSKTITGSF